MLQPVIVKGERGKLIKSLETERIRSVSSAEDRFNETSATVPLSVHHLDIDKSLIWMIMGSINGDQYHM